MQLHPLFVSSYDSKPHRVDDGPFLPALAPSAADPRNPWEQSQRTAVLSGSSLVDVCVTKTIWEFRNLSKLHMLVSLGPLQSSQWGHHNPSSLYLSAFKASVRFARYQLFSKRLHLTSLWVLTGSTSSLVIKADTVCGFCPTCSSCSVPIGDTY